MSALMHLPARSQCPQAGTAARDEASTSDIAVVHLGADARLALDTTRDNVICVADGLIYVQVGDDDVLLLGGEHIALRADEDVRAWNAGDDAAQVILYNRSVV